MAFLDQRPLPTHGAWGEITSSLLWCEEKYRFTRYIAEPANTFSNLFFLALALYGIRVCRAHDLPTRFILVYAGIALIGVGSFLFHATLKHEAQLLDELPMIYTSLVLTYAVCETTRRGEKKRFRILLPAVLVATAAGVTGGYLYSGNPVFHQVAYACIQLASTLRVLYLLYAPSSPLTSSPSALLQRAAIRRTFNRGALVFLSAFAIWNADNLACQWWRDMREKVGYPLAHAVNGHAWWHIGTGWGAYALTVASELLVLSLTESPDNFALRGSAWLPHVERVRAWAPDSKQKKGGSAGSVKREASRKRGKAQ